MIFFYCNVVLSIGYTKYSTNCIQVNVTNQAIVLTQNLLIPTDFYNFLFYANIKPINQFVVDQTFYHRVIDFEKKILRLIKDIEKISALSVVTGCYRVIFIYIYQIM